MHNFLTGYWQQWLVFAHRLGSGTPLSFPFSLSHNKLIIWKILLAPRVGASRIILVQTFQNIFPLSTAFLRQRKRKKNLCFKTSSKAFDYYISCGGTGVDKRIAGHIGAANKPLHTVDGKIRLNLCMDDKRLARLAVFFT